MKWLKYSTIPIGIFMLILTLLSPKVNASTTITYFETQLNVEDANDWRVSPLQLRYHSSRYIVKYDVSSIAGNTVTVNNFSNILDTSLVSFWLLDSSLISTNDPYYATPTSEFFIPSNTNWLYIYVRNGQTTSSIEQISFSYNSTPTDITTWDNILWNDDTWVDGNGGLTAQQYYYVSYLLDVSTLTNYDIVANNNPNFSDLAPNVTHIWYYDTSYSLIGSYNAYSDFGANTPNLSLNAHYIRIGAPVTNLGGYEPNEIKSTYITTTRRTLQYKDYNGNVVYQTGQVFVGDSTSTYDTLAQANLPNREGYVFTSWSGLTTVGSDPITVKEALYDQLPQYVVTFVDYDNTFIASGLVQQGQQATLPPTPTRDHYVFSHWEPPVADVQGNITTVAQYNPATYQVTWRDEQGNTLKIETVQYSGLATAPNYTPASGLVVNGWLDNDLPLPQIPLQSPIRIDSNKIFVVSLTTAPEPTNPNLPPEDYNPITDLLGGVMGASVGAIMTLGTINLFGIYLYQLIFLFIATTLTLWILKAVRG